jgi:hypothetical protein
MLVRAETLLRGGHPDLHKQGGAVVRDAAERFCKELLIKTRREDGDAASLNDYGGKNLRDLSPPVEIDTRPVASRKAARHWRGSQPRETR